MKHIYNFFFVEFSKNEMLKKYKDSGHPEYQCFAEVSEDILDPGSTMLTNKEVKEIVEENSKMKMKPFRLQFGLRFMTFCYILLVYMTPLMNWINMERECMELLQNNVLLPSYVIGFNYNNNYINFSI